MTQTESILESMQAAAGITADDARKVLALYKTLKVAKVSPHDGLQFAHGAFLDRDVILRALAQSYEVQL